MKQFKLFIWILVITLLSVAAGLYFNIGGICPNLLFSFAIAYSISERELPYRIGVTLICALISAAMDTIPFIMVILMFVYSSVMADVLNNKRNSISAPLRSAIYAFFFTGICKSVIYVLTTFTMDVSVLVKLILPNAALNAVFAAIICFAINAGMKKGRKTLLIS